MGPIIDAALQRIPSQSEREKFYTQILPAFMDHDWDTIDVVVGKDPAFDNALLMDYEWEANEAGIEARR